ncbi:MAG TPA: MFS transporter [Burkholderiales bacterium]|nr:MFS transporter [Burkholderiales bacterium]
METTSPRRAGRREWIGLGVIALPCMLYSMDLTVLNLAIPQLSAELKPSSSQLLWIVDIYGFLVAGFLITMGTLGDRIGRRKLLMFGATAFGIASVLAAFSNSAGMLIATRALLGIAAATLAPSTLSLIRNMFHDPKQRTFAIAMWITSFSVGAVIGPLVGGILLEHFWWGSVFLVAVPVMVLLLACAPFLLPEFKDPGAGRLDFFSALQSLVAVLAVIYGLKHVAQHGIGWTPVAFIAAGVAIGVAFLRRQRSLADPLIDLRLFRLPVFSAALAINILGFLVMFSAFLYIAQYLQLVLGLSPMKAGLWSVPSALAFIIGSTLTPAIVKRISRVHAMAGGLIVAALGFGILTQVHGDGALAVLVIGAFIYSLGMTPVVTLTTDFVVGSAPPERAGAAASLSETATEFGGALGIAVFGSIGTAVYRHRIDASLPSGTSPEVAAAVRDTLGGAVAAARETSQSGPVLLDAARDAFTLSFQVTSAISIGILVATAIIAIRMLRHAETGMPSTH